MEGYVCTCGFQSVWLACPCNFLWMVDQQSRAIRTNVIGYNVDTMYLSSNVYLCMVSTVTIPTPWEHPRKVSFCIQLYSARMVIFVLHTRTGQVSYLNSQIAN